MREFRYEIKDAQGIHARPADILAKAIAKYDSSVLMKKEGEEELVNAKSVMAVMSLGARKGSRITVMAEGKDEDAVIDEIERICKENL